MSLISGSIPNLVNGVSQQPYPIRLASQAEAQENAISSVVDGLGKRPPSRHKAVIPGANFLNAHVHTINRDPQERYVLILRNGAINVYDTNGNAKTVHAPHGLGYLGTGNAKEAFKCVTVADYTFILNKGAVVQKSPTLSPARPKEAIFWIRQSAYSTDYSIYVNGVQGYYKTPDSSNAFNAEYIKTNYIASQLVANLQTNGITAANGWNLYHNGSVIYVSRTNGADFTVNAQDSIGDQGIRAIKDFTQTFSDLPAKNVPHGFRVAIRGKATTEHDDYLVEFDSVNGASSLGVWKEAIQGGEQYALNPATMPHILVRNPDGSFTFKQAEWGARTAGDNKSAPFPSFVDRPLNDVFFFRNRLGILADENVIFSMAGEFFKFFRESAVQTLETDPIDVGVSHVKVSILRHAIPFNEALLLFSDQTQFRLGSTQLLTPQTISINATTEFECSLRSRPVGAGSNVYFAVNRGDYSAIREYFMDADTEVNDAADVTAHCPKYLPSNVHKLTASPNEDTLVALSEKTPNTLYVYRYYWDGNEKIQSSWSKWTFSGSILNADFIESDLWLVIQRSDGVYLEVISIEPGRSDSPATIQCLLDRRVTNEQFAISYDAATNRTGFWIPGYRIADDPTTEYVLVVWPQEQVTALEGKVYKPAITTNDATGLGFSVPGDLRGYRVYFGRRYRLRYEFSQIHIREEAIGGGVQTVGSGRLQIRKITITCGNSGFFRVNVTPRARDTYRYEFTGMKISEAALGRITTSQGLFPVPVRCRNTDVMIEVVSESHLPCALLSVEWEGYYTSRSSRS